VNPESKKAQDKPVLNVESFQRLLAAAYMLQVPRHRTSVQPVSAGRPNPFTAEAIVQEQSLSLLVQESRLQAGKRDVVRSRSPNTTDHPPGPPLPEMVPVVTEIPVANEVAKVGLHSDTLAPTTGPTALQRMNISLRRPTSWRTVEALAIAIVFCTMIGVSIYRLLAFPVRISLSSEKPEQRHVSQPTSAPKAQPIVTRDSRQSADGGDADLIAEDIVIRCERRAVDRRGQAAKKPRAMQAQPLPEKKVSSKPGVRLTFGQDAEMLVANTVIQYGADVTTWSVSPTKRTALDHLGRR
jgi:hypothetical protein